MPHPTLSPTSLVDVPKKLAIEPGSLQELGRFFALTDTAVLSTRGILKDVSPAHFTMLVEEEEPHPHGAQYFAYGGNEQVAFYVSSLDAPKKVATNAPAQLRHLGGRYVTDGKHVFFNGAKLPAHTDVGSFERLSWCYARDARSCYHFNKRILGANPRHFRIVCPSLEDAYTYLGADEDTAFYYDMAIPDSVGSCFQAIRSDAGHVIGASDGQRSWTTGELADLARAARVRRQVAFATEVANIRMHEGAFAGLEERLALFLLLCDRQSIEALETFTRGRRGENAVVRAISLLNERSPSPLAEVSAQTIHITALGRAVHQQFGAGVQAVTSCLEELTR